MSIFQVQLRKARNAAKLTQENIATELGVSKSQVSAWETGKESPSIKHLPKLRKVLGVSLDSLFIPERQLALREEHGVYDLSAAMASLSDADLNLIVKLITRLRRL